MMKLRLFRRTDMVSCNGCGGRGDGKNSHRTLLYFSCETEPDQQTGWWGTKNQVRFCKTCLTRALPAIQKFCQ